MKLQPVVATVPTNDQIVAGSPRRAATKLHDIEWCMLHLPRKPSGVLEERRWKNQLHAGARFVLLDLNKACHQAGVFVGKVVTNDDSLERLVLQPLITAEISSHQKQGAA